MWQCACGWKGKKKDALNDKGSLKCPDCHLLISEWIIIRGDLCPIVPINITAEGKVYLGNQFFHIMMDNESNYAGFKAGESGKIVIQRHYADE